MILLLGLVVTNATAHVPHDPVLAAAIPADGDTSVPWYLLLDPQGVELWLRSDDAGATWDMVGGEPTADTLLGAGRLADGAIALLGGSSLWWSLDDGSTWTPEPLPGAVIELRVEGDELLVIGDGGAFVGRPDQGWTTVTTEPVEVMGPGAAIIRAGDILVNDGAWTPVAPPPMRPASVAFDGAWTWVGTETGEVVGWDGASWHRCGALPDAGLDQGDVVRINLFDGALVVTTGYGGPYVSTDTCETWEDRGVPEAISYGEGGAGAAKDAQEVLQVAGSTWLVGGWLGLSMSDDQGASWVRPTLIPADYARGIAFSSDWDEQPDMFVAAYASAIERTPDGGTTWTGANHGINVTNAQRVITRREDPDLLFAIVNHRPWVSRDRGDSWRVLYDNNSTVDEILFWDNPAHIWLTGEAVEESLDAGQTWTTRTDVLSQVGGTRIGGMAMFGARACLTVADPSGYACSDDHGATWSGRTHGVDGRVSTPAAWPVDAPTWLLWGDASGIARVDMSTFAETWVTTEPVEDIVVAPDGQIFASTRSSQLLTSVDGGVTWTELGGRLPAHIHALAVRPDWVMHHELLAATHDGVYIITREGVARHLDYERVDNRSDYAPCSGCAAAVDDPTTDLDSIQPLTAGAIVEAHVRGTTMRVLGRAHPGGGAELSVDGVSYGLFGTEEAEGALVEIGGLPPGWHTVQIAAMPDGDVEFDTLEALGDNEGLDFSVPDPLTASSSTVDPLPEDTGDTGSIRLPLPKLHDTGCGGKQAGVWLGLGTLLGLRNRRRRA